MGKKSKNRSLGRGLGAILGEVAEAYENELQVDTVDNERVVEIPISSITANPYQPRKFFDENSIKELSESIKKHGLLQPIVVIEQNDGYMLIAGERRVRASKLAGLDKIRAIVADIDRTKFRELALIENIQREELNPVELARSYKELIEEHGITQEELSSIVHKSRPQITNTLRLLQLSDYVLERVASGLISQGHAKVLVGLSDKEQKVLCDTVIGRKLSVREVEALASKAKKTDTYKKVEVKKEEEFDLATYSALLNEHIPFKTKIKKNRLEISFCSEKELKSFIKVFSTKL